MEDSDDDIILKRKKKGTCILSDDELSSDTVSETKEEKTTNFIKTDKDISESFNKPESLSNLLVKEANEISQSEIEKALESSDDELELHNENSNVQNDNDTSNNYGQTDEEDMSSSKENIFNAENENKKGFKKEKQNKNKSRTLKDISLEKKELLDIHAESQRLVRESKFRLPYHRPPQITLTEFLKKREKSRIFTTNRPPKLNDILIMEKRNHLQNKYLKIFNEKKKDTEIDEINFEVIQNKEIEKVTKTTENLEFDNDLVKSNELIDKNESNKDSSETNMKDKDEVCVSHVVKIKEKLKEKFGSHVPRLSGSPNSVISFGEEKPKKSNLECFIEKFVKHTEKSQKVIPDVKKSNENKIAFESTKEMELDTPGAKLMKLKEMLKIKMEERKEILCKKRMETYQLENEEGFENDKSDESEAELTDQTDTDEEIADDEGTDSEEEQELSGVKYRKKKKSVFVDDEAEDDDDDNDNNDEDGNNDDNSFRSDNDYNDNSDDLPDLYDLINCKSSSKETCSTQLKIDEKTKDLEIGNENSTCNGDTEEKESPEFCLFLETEETPLDSGTLCSNFGDEQEEKLIEKPKEHDVDTPNPIQNIDNSINMDNSFEFGRSLPPYQPGGGFKYNGFQHHHTESDCEDWFKSSLLNSQYNKLLEDNPETKENEVTASSEQKSEMLRLDSAEDFSHLALSDEESQYENNLTNKARIPNGLQDILDGNSLLIRKSDILSLCSGSFPDTFEGMLNTKETDASQTNSQNMQELLALCSGKFEYKNNSRKDIYESEDSDSSVEINYKRKKKKHWNRLTVDDSGSEKSFSINKDDLNVYSNKEEDSDSDDGDHELSTKEIEEDSTEKFTGFLDSKSGGIRKEFIEDEAELSGSDASEDEKEEDDEDDNDEFEEVNLLSDENLSEEELKNQVERLHHKAVLDEDNRELLLLQERYLPDGDLHSDGQGRQRKFRWKNIDDNLAIENSDQSSGEDDGLEESNEIWRIKRYEREKWFQEQQENGNSKLFSPDKSTDFLFSNKNNKKVNIRKDSFAKFLKEKATSNNFSSSFLAKGKDFLNRLALNLKKEDEGVGRRCTKNIIFQTSVPEKENETKAENLKRKPDLSLSQNKRLKFSSQASASKDHASVKNSVFDYLEIR
ncbi:claspin-like [Centruroides vittatus]|uniref:claspin-like n=1 Tax=Centruroides vittatus TaxID=120091 RepID=UPI00350EF9A6